MEHGDNIGRYIKKSELELARKLANKDYCELVICEAEKQLAYIKKFLKSYQPEELGMVYERLHIGRRELISNLVLSDEEYIKKWQEEKYDNNPNYQDDLKYETKRGEYVRSKSEKMIADIYYEMGIPYRYEYPLHFDNGMIRYPDFTLLKMPERKLIYHEHLGLLDDSEYVNNNINKIMEYEREGIYEGVSLILTGESSEFPFNEVKNMAAQSIIQKR